jgi:polysaccharide biosynthesis/export protein
MKDFRAMQRTPFKLVVLALAILLSACGGNVPPLANDSHEAPVYRLAAGDKLRIVVFGEEALSKEYTITSAGDLSFPLLGDIQASGRTPTELQSAITAGLSEGYLNDPRVNVEVLNFRPFYILGEVSKAGEYPYATDLTVFQAVALAGGFTYRADQRRVFIRRAGSDQELTYELSDGRAVYIQPGDTIRVGERYF